MTGTASSSGHTTVGGAVPRRRREAQGGDLKMEKGGGGRAKSMAGKVRGAHIAGCIGTQQKIKQLLPAV